MNNFSDLTIITPTLNSENFLEYTLENTKPLRDLGANHIIIDGGSQDNTLSIAQKFGCKTYECKSPGMYAAINYGMKNHCNTLFATYINCDDYLNYEWIANNLNQLYAQEVDAIYGDIHYVCEKGKVIGRWTSIKQSFMGRMLFKCFMPIHQHGFIFKKELYKMLNGFDEKFKLASDLDFIYRAYIGARLLYIPGAAGSFRLHTAQLTKTAKDYGASEIAEFRKKNNVECNKVLKILLLIYYKVKHIPDYIFRFRSSGLKKVLFWK